MMFIFSGSLLFKNLFLIKKHVKATENTWGGDKNTNALIQYRQNIYVKYC